MLLERGLGRKTKGWDNKRKASRFDGRVYFLGWERSGELEVKNNRVRKNRDVFIWLFVTWNIKLKDSAVNPFLQEASAQGCNMLF